MHFIYSKDPFEKYVTLFWPIFDPLPSPMGPCVICVKQQVLLFLQEEYVEMIN